MVDEARASHLALNLNPPPSSSSSPSSSSPRGERGPETNKVNPVSVIIYALAVVACLAFIIYYAHNLEQDLEDVKKLGFAGNLIVMVSYLPAGLPIALVSYYIPLSLAVGCIYSDNLVLGIFTAMVGSVSASLFGFWITRTFCRVWITEKIKASARLSALLLAMEIHSFKITLLVRFLPLPFGLQNALCALTSITAPKFLLSSAIGLLPENLLLIYFGSTFPSISQISAKNGNFGSVTPYEKIVLGVMVVVTCVVFFLARRMVDDTVAKARSIGKKDEDDVEMLLLVAEQGEKKSNGNGKDGEVEGKKYDNFAKERESTKDSSISSHTPLKLSKSSSSTDRKET